jgi:3-phenylpropionate/trans-cinnamate dioxygenase ferredoxin subunit
VQDAGFRRIPLFPVLKIPDKGDPMDEVKITCMKNGPFEVVGKTVITDGNGKVVSSADKNTYHLCRCGGSKNKPFCDGTHSRIHFLSE